MASSENFPGERGAARSGRNYAVGHRERKVRMKKWANTVISKKWDRRLNNSIIISFANRKLTCVKDAKGTCVGSLQNTCD